MPPGWNDPRTTTTHFGDFPGSSCRLRVAVLLGSAPPLAPSVSAVPKFFRSVEATPVSAAATRPPNSLSAGSCTHLSPVAKTIACPGVA
ncbi:hypothetical protein CA237_03595 [Sphingomonas sp. ABOLH]|nr:hypothetical protein CA237_03595 [Sphingomonas sp. ABOLH]